MLNDFFIKLEPALTIIAKVANFIGARKQYLVINVYLLLIKTVLI